MGCLDKDYDRGGEGGPEVEEKEPKCLKCQCYIDNWSDDVMEEVEEASGGNKLPQCSQECIEVHDMGRACKFNTPMGE